MGEKSNRNRGASRVQQSARVQQGGVTNTSATIRRDPIIDSLGELLKKKDCEGILKLESKLVLRATGLEGTEPTKASAIYLAIANAFVESEFSSLIAREKAIHYMERSFALSVKDVLHECVRQLVPLYLRVGRHDEAFATVKRLTVRIPQHELIDPDVILSIATDFYHALLNERV